MQKNSLDKELAEVANKLTGLPTAEELKALYIRFDFDRKRLAEHLKISTIQLLRMKKQLLGNCTLPNTGTYKRHYADHQWYTRQYAEWAHPPKYSKCFGNSTDE